jgi:5-methylcytosine-specific restriction endonuclease McrA
LFVEEWKKGGPGGNGYIVSNHVRRYLLEQSDYKCSCCGWSQVNPHTGNVPLEIDHIDNDPFNHSQDNLQVLCPNCHAVKTLPPNKSKGGRYKNGGHPKGV